MKAWIKSLKGRFGVTAPKVAVRAHMPWYMRWAALAGVGVLLIAVSWATYHFGSEFAGFRKSEIEGEMKRLNDLAASQQAEIAELRTKFASSESQRQIEAATYGGLEKQVKLLATENATLKDELAFFQSVVPTSGRDENVAVNRFKLDPGAMPGEYRYRLLLVQGGQRPTDFQGRVELVINAVQDGRKVVVTLPAENDVKNQEFLLNFKSYQRVEGMLKVDPAAVVRAVQIRVYQNGVRTPKLTQSVTIS